MGCLPIGFMRAERHADRASHVLGRECEQYARHMTKADPKDGSILNFNSPEEQEAVEVVFNNAISPLAEVGSLSADNMAQLLC